MGYKKGSKAYIQDLAERLVGNLKNKITDEELKSFYKLLNDSNSKMTVTEMNNHFKPISDKFNEIHYGGK